MRILLSNDDGVHARGIHAMYKELKKLGQVWVVAPTEEMSTTGHSLTLHKPLRLARTPEGFYAVNGSPADCVNLGIREVMKKKPDLVVSGINRGANLGQDVYYSGTVSAAREACIMGIPSVAVSTEVDFKKRPADDFINYATAAKTSVKLIREILRGKNVMPPNTLLNINVPDVPLARLKGIRWGRQGHRYYSGTILKRRDHRGKDYYWVGGFYKGFKDEEGTDCNWVSKGYASIVPIQLDSTHYAGLRMLEQLFPEYADRKMPDVSKKG